MDEATILFAALLVMTLTWTLWWIRWWRLRLAETPGQRQNAVNNLPVGLLVLLLFGLLPGVPMTVGVGELYPQALMVVTPIICNGEPRLEAWSNTSAVRSWPHKITCNHANGRYEDITLRTIVASSVGLAAVILTFFIWLRSAWLLRRLLRRRRGLPA